MIIYDKDNKNQDNFKIEQKNLNKQLEKLNYIEIFFNTFIFNNTIIY